MLTRTSSELFKHEVKIKINLTGTNQIKKRNPQNVSLETILRH